MLADGRFLPGGRILAGAGTGRRLTLFNCFVLGTIGDFAGRDLRGPARGAR
jgi:ribonucleoside-diphosphate reductase alpha chain